MKATLIMLFSERFEKKGKVDVTQCSFDGQHGNKQFTMFHDFFIGLPCT